MPCIFACQGLQKKSETNKVNNPVCPRAWFVNMLSNTFHRVSKTCFQPQLISMQSPTIYFMQFLIFYCQTSLFKNKLPSPQINHRRIYISIQADESALTSTEKEVFRYTLFKLSDPILSWHLHILQFLFPYRYF